jgi:hypothetical protein
MRTTLDINDALLAKAKAVAAQEQTSLTRLIRRGWSFGCAPKPDGLIAADRRYPSMPGTTSLCSNLELEGAGRIKK